MIRDPSDGSVRRQTIAPPVSSGAEPATAPVSPGSGLRAEQAAMADRLRKSREWLDRYQAAKRAQPVSPELDKAIQDELDHPPASILKED